MKKAFLFLALLVLIGGGVFAQDTSHKKLVISMGSGIPFPTVDESVGVTLYPVGSRVTYPFPLHTARAVSWAGATGSGRLHNGVYWGINSELQTITFWLNYGSEGGIQWRGSGAYELIFEVDHDNGRADRDRTVTWYRINSVTITEEYTYITITNADLMEAKIPKWFP